MNEEIALDAGWDETFLDWFAGLQIPIVERKLKLGEFEYFHFSSQFGLAPGKQVSAFGSHVNRQTAAIKCAAEMIERKTMFRYFEERKSQIPKAFQNSNGWAVHQSRELAEKKAKSEALERHLLLLSFLRLGWSGFKKVQTLSTADISILFLVSKASSTNSRAGFVVSRSAAHKGVSFGHCLIEDETSISAEAWQSGLFESVGKHLIPTGAPQGLERQSWITRETNRYLNDPFDLSVFDAGDVSDLESDIGEIEVDVIDLSTELNLKFPLFAAFARGGNLLPLFSVADLDSNSERQLVTILKRNGISEIPQRHPVL